MFILMEMFSGRILSDKTISDRAEAERLNDKFLSVGSFKRYACSLTELGRYEEEYRELAAQPKPPPQDKNAEALKRLKKAYPHLRGDAK